MTDGLVEYKQDDKAVRQHVGMYSTVCVCACRKRAGKAKWWRDDSIRVMMRWVRLG